MDPAPAAERQSPRAGNGMDPATVAERQLLRAGFVVATRQAARMGGRIACRCIAAPARRAVEFIAQQRTLSRRIPMNHAHLPIPSSAIADAWLMRVGGVLQ